MSERTLTVDNSEFGYFPEGMTLTVERDHTNRFTGRRVLTLGWDSETWEVPNRTVQSEAQVARSPEDTEWTEIHSGLSREHERLTFEG